MGISGRVLFVSKKLFSPGAEGYNIGQGERMTLSMSLSAAGIISPEKAERVERQAESRKALAALERRVQDCLHKAQKSGKPADWSKYCSMEAAPAAPPPVRLLRRIGAASRTPAVTDNKKTGMG